MKKRTLREMSPQEKATVLFNEYVMKGLSFREIAFKYGTTHQNISYILKGRLEQSDLDNHKINRTERKYELFKQSLVSVAKKK